MDNLTPVREIKHRKRKPSARQVKAFHYMSQGMSKRAAMLKAGYSLNVANTHGKWLTQESMASRELFDNLKRSLTGTKITGEYLANKFQQWLEAQKDDKADYKTQLQAFRELMGAVKPAENTSEGVKRKITFEEFVGIEEGKKLE